MIGRAWPRLDDLAHPLRPALSTEVETVNHVVPQAFGVFDFRENKFLKLALGNGWIIIKRRKSCGNVQADIGRFETDGRSVAGPAIALGTGNHLRTYGVEHDVAQ